MGLLSDPEYGSVKWVKVLKKVHTPICILCYFGAIAWYIGLGHKDVNNETYFSENALLPGLVTNEFNAEQSAKQIHSELLLELKDKYEDTSRMPVPWLVAKMSQLHLEVYTHNFTLNSPLSEQVYTGTNVYGILRAARSSSLEALVISVPYRALSSHLKGTTASIALMLSFAQFARPQKYWAKDIIFLVTEHEQLGMQAWLEAYHGLQSEAETFHKSLASFWEPGISMFDVSSLFGGIFGTMEHNKCLNPGELKGRSGSIQAAINLEFHTPKIKYIEVKVEGLNGQLPNLDLVNLIHKLCDKYGVHHSYQKSYSWIHTRNKMEKWKSSVRTMLAMFTAQLSGVPNGNHGLFHRFGIEAVTLEGREANDPAGDPPRVNAIASTNFYRLGVVLESAMRSLNNLLERFHQSYFFYILAGTDRFVSIGQYMPTLALICVSLLIRALAMWVSVPPRDVAGANELEGGVKAIPINLSQIATNHLVIHFFGYLVMNSSKLLINIGTTVFNTSIQNSIFYGLLIVSIILAIVAPIIHRQFRNGPISPTEFAIVYIWLLTELATTCLCTGMHSFQIGLLFAIIYLPLCLVMGGVSCRDPQIPILRGCKVIFCLLLHPMAIITILLIVFTKLSEGVDIWTAIQSGIDISVMGITYAVTDYMVYGNWVFQIMTTTLLPFWLLFWQLLWANYTT